MINIKDFCDMEQFEQIMSNWAKATGLATVAVGADGRYISECYNFTEFCIDLTRKSPEGCRRCEKCDREGKGVYFCHAGLIDFGIELKIGDEVVGSVIGGQVLSEAPDDEKFRAVAREIGVNEDRYIAALHKVTIRSEEAIRASAELLGAGRQKKGDPLDFAAGITLHKKRGDYVHKGESIATFYGAADKFAAAAEEYRSGLVYGSEKPEEAPLVYALVTKDGVERY